MALSEIDRNLLERCLEQKARAWEDFVDRFMGLVVHVVTHSAQTRGLRLTREDCEDLCAEVFLNLLKDDFAILRRFRGNSSLATYLAVVARRIVVRCLLGNRSPRPLGDSSGLPSEQIADTAPSTEQRVADREQLQQMIDGLDDTEGRVVRMYHLEGRSYREISHAVGMSENSVGPILTRARGKMRRAGA